MPLGGIVLAAGWGRRMGRPKAQLPVKDRGCAMDVLRSALEGAGIDPLVTVVGPWWRGAMRPDLAKNPDPDRGQASSIRMGLAALPPGLSGVVIALVDQFLVRVDTLRLLVAEHAAHPEAIVVPCWSGRRGHPVVFPSWAFAALADPALDTVGARAVVRANAERMVEVAVTDAAVRMDFDTQEGYLRSENAELNTSLIQTEQREGIA